MIGLDTNVLVRYLTQDDPAQSAVVNRLFERTLSQSEPGFVSAVVLCEFTWVLKAAYGVDSAQILRAVEGLLTTRQLVVQFSEQAWRALAACQRHRGASFSDGFIGQLSLLQGASTTVTFDKAAAKLEGFALLR